MLIVESLMGLVFHCPVFLLHIHSGKHVLSYLVEYSLLFEIGMELCPHLASYYSC